MTDSSSNPGPGRQPADVRMKGFARRATVEDATAWTDQQTCHLPAESVPLDELAGRVLANDIVSEVDVPGFPRSMMDGFALRADDIAGASTYNPISLDVVGEVLPGTHYEGRVERNQAVRIMTGAPIPAGADSVLPVEKTNSEGVDKVLVLDVVPEKKNVGLRGEDIRSGERVLVAGRRLRPQDIGVLSSIGIGQADAVRRPRVRIVITGNELLPSGTRPVGMMIADANGPMLAALVQRDGGCVVDRRITADSREAILNAMHDEVEIILVSGGSSVGVEDFAPQLLAEHGHLAFHGIAMRPSSPSGMGKLGDRLVFLLPGNPVSCLCSYDFFAGRAVRGFAGHAVDWPYRKIRRPLKRKVVSQIGRVDYARVKIVDGLVDPIAISGASLLSSTTRSDGFLIVPAGCEGYPPASEVDVYLYDR